MDKEDSKQSVNKILEENKEFIIIGLTGKIKAGTNDVCKLLTDEKFCDRVTKPADTSEISMLDARERTLCYRYLHHNWKSFVEINVACIIFSFLLESEKTEMQKVEIASKNIMELIDECIKEKDFKVMVKKKILKIIENVRWNDKKEIEEISTRCDAVLQEIDCFEDLYKKWKGLSSTLEIEKYEDSELLCFCYGVLPIVNSKLKIRLCEIENIQNFINILEITCEHMVMFLKKKNMFQIVFSVFQKELITL